MGVHLHNSCCAFNHACFGSSPRGEAGRQEFHSHIDLLPVALVLVIHGALQDLRSQVARRAADLCEDRAEYPPETPRRVCAIPTTPKQVNGGGLDSRWGLCSDCARRE